MQCFCIKYLNYISDIITIVFACKKGLKIPQKDKCKKDMTKRKRTKDKQ